MTDSRVWKLASPSRYGWYFRAKGGEGPCRDRKDDAAATAAAAAAAASSAAVAAGKGKRLVWPDSHLDGSLAYCSLHFTPFPWWSLGG